MNQFFPNVGHLRDDIGSVRNTANTLCLCIGDSVQHGQGVDRKETLSSYLQHFLSTGKDKIEVKTLNAGVCGYGALDSAFLYDLLLRHLIPDLIVWELCNNDIEMTHCDVPNDTNHILEIWKPESPHRQFIYEAFKVLKTVAVCPVLVVYYGQPEFGVEVQASREIEELCKSNQFWFLNGMEIVRNIPVRDRTVGEEDIHPSRTVHQLIAKQVSNIVKKNKLIHDRKSHELDPVKGDSISTIIESWRSSVKRLSNDDFHIFTDTVFLKKCCEVISIQEFEDFYLAYAPKKYPQINFCESVACFPSFLESKIKKMISSIEWESAPAQYSKIVEPFCSILSQLKNAIPLIENCRSLEFRGLLSVLHRNIAFRMHTILELFRFEQLKKTIELFGHENNLEMEIYIETESDSDTVVILDTITQDPDTGSFRDTFNLKYGRGTIRRTLPSFVFGRIIIYFFDHKYFKIKDLGILINNKVAKRFFPVEPYIKNHRIVLGHVNLLSDADITNKKGFISRPDLLGALETIFPKQKRRLAIYTGGRATRNLLKCGWFYGFEIVCIIDKHVSGYIEDIPVHPLDQAIEMDIDYILVSSSPFYNEIREELRSVGLNEFHDFSLLALPEIEHEEK